MISKYLQFLWGVGSENQRTNYQADDIKATQSTYDYRGIVTKKYLDDHGMQVWVIDGAVVYTTVDDNKRQQVQNALYYDGLKSYGTSLVGVGVLGYSMYKFSEGYTQSGIAGGLFGLSLSLLAAGRGMKAGDESIKWVDKTDEICKSRKDNSKNFNNLEKSRWRGTLFTADETKHVFYRHIDHLQEVYDEKMGSGDRFEQIQAIDHFVKNNPIKKSSLKYAFGNSDIIDNPGETDQGYRKRADMDKLAKTSKKLGRAHSRFCFETRENMDLLRRGITISDKLSMVAQDSIDSGADRALLPYIVERDHNLEQLEKQKASLGPLQYSAQKKAIEAEYKNKPEVKEILDQKKQSQIALGMLNIGAKLGLFASMDVYTDNRQKQLVDKFSPQVDAVFEDYEKIKINKS